MAKYNNKINNTKMKEFNDDNFAQEVKGAKGVAVVDFWAPWCAPCRALSPTIEAIAGEYEGKAVVGKFNVDAGVVVPAEYGIRSIPTILFFKDGELVDKLIGAVSKSALVEKIESLI